jgi:hypothetical protein
MKQAVAQPTRRKSAVPTCAVGHGKNGVMVEESVCGDSLACLRQIGIAR